MITKERGLPLEVHFEFSASLAYTLVYTYDLEQREVRWQSKLGKRDGVAGFARFEACDGGTRLSYGLEHGSGRTPADRALGDPAALAEALRAWIVNQR